MRPSTSSRGCCPDHAALSSTSTHRTHRVHHIRLAVEDLPSTPEPGTDAAYLAAGWITVTGIEPVTGVVLGLDADVEAGLAMRGVT